jgi:hypothetical protein
VKITTSIISTVVLDETDIREASRTFTPQRQQGSRDIDTDDPTGRAYT